MKIGARRLGRGVLRRVRRWTRRPGGPVILMYHRVAQPTYDPWELAVSPANFERQMAWLKQRRTVLPLEEFERLRQRGKLPRNAAAVTFDDGYACNALTAAPVLAVHEVPATIFLTTGAVSSEMEFWWDDLERIISATKARTLSVEIAGQKIDLDLGEPDAGLDGRSGTRAETYETLWRAMRTLDTAARRTVLADLAQRCGVGLAGRPEYRALTQKEVVDLSRSPWISFGAHSVSHPPLSTLTAAEQRDEIETSRAACARLTGVTPATFAYPYGDYDDETVRLVEEAGFTVAVTTDPGAVQRGVPSLRLPRVQVGDWSDSHFASVLAS